MPVQMLLAHSAFVVHGCPVLSKHVPAPLQELTPVHVVVANGSSLPTGSNEHAPTEPITLQLWQVAVHALLQHTPSTQKLLKQFEAMVQVCPAFALHMPLPLHAFVTEQAAPSS